MDVLKRSSLFRSLSMSMRDKGHKQEGQVRKNSKGSQKAVSASLDDIELNMSCSTLEECYLGGNGSFSRTEGMQCLIIPDNLLLTEIVRHQRSFSLNSGCDHCKHNTVKPDKTKLPLSRSTSLKTTARKSLTNAVVSPSQTRSIKTIPRSQTVHSFNHEERKGESEVQLKRCLSLYKRKRTPHTCCHNDHKDRDSKPKSNINYNVSSASRERKLSKETSSRTRTSSSMSIDSAGLSNGRTSSMSVTSKSSSDFDFDHSPRKAKTVAHNADKFKSNEVETFKSARPSQIPRPVTPAREQIKRPRSFTVSGTNLAGTEFDYKKNSNRSLKKSQSFKEKTKSGFHRSALSSLVQTPVNGCRENNTSSQQPRDLSQYLNSFDVDGAKLLERKKAVPDDEEGYPVPQPSTKTRADIYNPRDFVSIDQKVAEIDNGTVLDSFEELLQVLLVGLSSDIAKVRALYRWLVVQELPLSVLPAYRSLQTPRGFLFNIGQNRATYAELFAKLCRKADIMCTVIHGIAKGVNYKAGDKVTYKKCKNSWNAVYLEDGWRLVHPYWATRTVNGYRTGRWTVVESDTFHMENDVPNIKRVMEPNDFYFLTDPDKFITKCFPDDDLWQLLHKPLSKPEYEDIPFLQSSFYDLKLSVQGNHSCTVRSNNGKAEIKIGVPSDRGKRYEFGYKLLARQQVESEGEYDMMILNRYILHYVHENTAMFEIRFPIIGVFNLEIHCTDPKRPLKTDWVCDYKIICSEVMPECEPLPIIPHIGWGPGEALDEYGIESLSFKQPVVSLDGDTVTHLRFALPKNKTFKMEAVLFSNNQSPDELSSHVVTETDDDTVIVKVSPPGEGEYALQMYVKEDNVDRKNVCNFLMHRTQIVEDPELADIRAELINSTDSGDVDILSHWVDKFLEHNMEDRGDLSQAKKKLIALRLNRDIREAMERKDLDLLEKLLHSSSASDVSIRQSLGDLAVQAEVVRSRLRRLKRLRHEVLAMDQKTISEMRSYPKPPQAVHSVMAATFLLLGNKESDLKRWAKVQSLIMKKGKDALKRRVAEFNIEKVSPAVLERVHTILSRFDLETVQIASAGAATFYQWAITMAGEADPMD